MIAVLVWVLVTVGYDARDVQYSPPTQDLASCQRMEKFVAGKTLDHQCVQINMMVSK